MTGLDPRIGAGMAVARQFLPAWQPSRMLPLVERILSAADSVVELQPILDTVVEHLPAKPECRERYVTEVRTGDMVWSDEDRWFYRATLDAHEHDGKVRLSYEDDLAWAEFWHDESVLVARDPAEALAWNGQRNAESVHLDEGPTPDVLAELDIQPADSDGAARLDPGAAA